MRPEPEILLALRNHLVTFAQPLAIPIAFTNKNFAPPAGGKYLREAFIPNIVARPYLASDEPNQFRGIYQVSVAWPSGAGETEPRSLAGAIADHFAVDARLTSNGIITRVYKRAEVGSLMVDDTGAMIPVSIYWQSIS